jgi:(2Fe-2S) ferredoxin
VGKAKRQEGRVVLCVGGACRKAGAGRLRERLELALEEAGGRGAATHVLLSGCLGRCKKGVNAVLWPEGTCVSRLEPKHASTLAAHLAEGQRLPKRLRAKGRKKVLAKAARRIRRSAA